MSSVTFRFRASDGSGDMKPGVRELTALSLLTAFCCGLAWAHADTFFAAVFGGGGRGSRYDHLDVGDDGVGHGVNVQGATEITREQWDGFEISDYPMPTVTRADRELLAASSPSHREGLSGVHRLASGP